MKASKNYILVIIVVLVLSFAAIYRQVSAKEKRHQFEQLQVSIIGHIASNMELDRLYGFSEPRSFELEKAKSSDRYRQSPDAIGIISSLSLTDIVKYRRDHPREIDRAKRNARVVFDAEKSNSLK